MKLGICSNCQKEGPICGYCWKCRKCCECERFVGKKAEVRIAGGKTRKKKSWGESA